MERITSRDNERVKHALHLAASAAQRREEGLFFAEGRRLCLDVGGMLACQTLFVTQKALEEAPQLEALASQLFLVSDSVAEKLAGTKTTQGVFGLFPLPLASLADLEPENGVLLLENIQDPANVGALLRSAAAFGLGGAVLAGECADAFSPKALRASMGAAVRLPVVAGVTIPEAVDTLHEAGVTLYASALQEATELTRVEAKRPFGLLVGNEGAGLSAAALAAADVRVCIPMHAGVDSLNAAVAGSVLMFALSQG